MANFRSNERGRRDSRNSRGGFRGNSGFRRDSGRFDRKPAEMHNAICDKCGKECQVPFKPSGDKPVLCSDCFEKSGNSNRSFGSRDRSRTSSSGRSSNQLDKIEAKLDKIIKAMEIDSD
ncbi:hypothetical protein COV15_02420 [Candidatus Woesearchaeota archaeon CG10_big_fil_rev_8_21_14_0_10_34_12]|nr:MAG: hypothetical protein COV15_02420 [Candidatus Woesearchaeota archaeon CG10_big_fil_rev_8_21_14_0_10_34_12]